MNCRDWGAGIEEPVWEIVDRWHSEVYGDGRTGDGRTGDGRNGGRPAG